jgi:uncharacterized phage protein (TIGR01671 family)
MREIKFRVWYQGKMRFPINMEFCPDGLFGINVPDNDGLPHYTEKGYTLMQFTGLRDKNGKEIYEGDVVTVTNWLNGEPWEGHIHNCEIEFKGGKFDLKDHWMHESLESSDVTVIGNIYENPELVKPS